jgi:hypothetical protein
MLSVPRTKKGPTNYRAFLLFNAAVGHLADHPAEPVGASLHLMPGAVSQSRCRLWAIGGHRNRAGPCPFFPRNRTFVSAIALLHQKSGAMLERSQREISFLAGSTAAQPPRFVCIARGSALPPKADVGERIFTHPHAQLATHAVSVSGRANSGALQCRVHSPMGKPFRESSQIA